MTGFLLNVALAATIFNPHRVVVTDLKGEGIDTATASMLTALLGEALARDPQYSVRDRHDLEALLIHDKEQQLVGCNDDGCFADISKFVGAESIITGKVGKVGAELVATVSRIDAARGEAVQRVIARATTVEALGREVQLLAAKVMAEKEAPRTLPTKLGAATGERVATLENHDDCHWAAVRLESDPDKRQVFQADFPSTHFRFGKHDPLNENLALDPNYYFLGDFHSCFPRDKDSVDAFTMSVGSLVVKADGARAAELRKALTENHLELVLRFVIAGSAMTPGRAYDWENCEGRTVKPFKPSEIYPTAQVKVRAAVLRDTASGETYSLVFQSKKDGDVSPVATIE
jgi:hypothetical protein